VYSGKISPFFHGLVLFYNKVEALREVTLKVVVLMGITPCSLLCLCEFRVSVLLRIYQTSAMEEAVGSSELQPETVIKWDMCSPVLTETHRLSYDVISVNTPTVSLLSSMQRNGKAIIRSDGSRVYLLDFPDAIGKTQTRTERKLHDSLLVGRPADWSVACYCTHSGIVHSA
jgi:hypothetical protein